MPTDLEPLLDELSQLVQDQKWETFFAAFREKIAPLGASRKRLQEEVVATIHRLEDLLSGTLRDQPLKGSYNIFTSVMPLNAWNVRRQNKSDKLRLPRNDQHYPQALVLLPDGKFWIVEITYQRRVIRGYEEYQYMWELCEPLDEDFRIEDLRLCMETIVQA